MKVRFGWIISVLVLAFGFFWFSEWGQLIRLQQAQTLDEMRDAIRSIPNFGRDRLFRVLDRFSKEAGTKVAFHKETGAIAFVGEDGESTQVVVNLLDPDDPLGGYSYDDRTDYYAEGVFLAESDSQSVTFVLREVSRKSGAVEYSRETIYLKEDPETSKTGNSVLLVDYYFEENLKPEERERFEEKGTWPKEWE